MAINIVNTTSEEKSFNFLTNQSSILHTANTNNITVNGVNVIVDKPKKGDVMCVTRYTDESGTLLPADSQKVVWIDGLSINPKQLSQEFEPVGICVVVNGNKVMVRYREERAFRWSEVERLELPFNPILRDGLQHTFIIKIDGVEKQPFEIQDTDSFKGFIDKLNNWFRQYSPDFSAEAVVHNTDLPQTEITEDGANPNFRIIVNAPAKTNNTYSTFSIYENGYLLTGVSSVTAKHIGSIPFVYSSDGFDFYWCGCIRSIYYKSIQQYQISPVQPMEETFIVSGGLLFGFAPAKKEDFESNDNCQILRDNFSSYDEYFDSRMLKFPCGRGGVITEFPSGKENTYKLLDCTFLNNSTGQQSPLYPAANYAASIDIKAPKLDKGNWWLPSAAEMAQIMRDRDLTTDIISTVIRKFTSIPNSGWNENSWYSSRWTSSKASDEVAFYCGSVTDKYTSSNSITLNGLLATGTFAMEENVFPITIYEF